MRKRMLLLTKGNHWRATLLTNYSSEKERAKKEIEVLQKKDCKNGLHPLAIYIKRQIVF